MANTIIKKIEFTLTQVKTKPVKKKSPGRPKKYIGEPVRGKPEKGTMRYKRMQEQWIKASHRYYQKTKADRELARAVRRMENETNEKMQKLRKGSEQ